MKNKPGIVDTNLLVYAHDRQSPYFRSAFEFLRNLKENNAFFLAWPVIGECFRILTEKVKKPITPDKFWQIFDYYQEIGVPIIYPTSKTFSVIKNLAVRYRLKGVEIFDSQIVALAIENNLKMIYTHNKKDFSRYKEVEVFDPFS